MNQNQVLILIVICEIVNQVNGEAKGSDSAQESNKSHINFPLIVATLAVVTLICLLFCVYCVIGNFSWKSRNSTNPGKNEGNENERVKLLSTAINNIETEGGGNDFSSKVPSDNLTLATPQVSESPVVKDHEIMGKEDDTDVRRDSQFSQSSEEPGSARASPEPPPTPQPKPKQSHRIALRELSDSE